MDSKPFLTDPNVKYYFKNVLSDCNKVKLKYNNLIFNIILIIIFILILSIILYSRYKGNITPEEIKDKRQKEKQYIISKLVQLSDHKKKQSQNLITNLPHWANNPESFIFNKNN